MRGEPYVNRPNADETRRAFRRDLVFSGVRRELRGQTPGKEMTSEQILYRAQQAEQRLERYIELEREREAAGLYEEALEARRLRLEQEAAVAYWRSRAVEE
jgi:hypothetical protein